MGFCTCAKDACSTEKGDPILTKENCTNISYKGKNYEKIKKKTGYSGNMASSAYDIVQTLLYRGKNYEKMERETGHSGNMASSACKQ